VEQDYLRRVLLRERDQPDGVAPALIDQTVRFCLDHGYHVVLEGILAASRHAAMISGLLRAHRGRSFVFYLDVSLDETLRRHATRPQSAEFSGEATARPGNLQPPPPALGNRSAPRGQRQQRTRIAVVSPLPTPRRAFPENHVAAFLRHNDRTPTRRFLSHDRRAARDHSWNARLMETAA